MRQKTKITIPKLTGVRQIQPVKEKQRPKKAKKAKEASSRKPIAAFKFEVTDQGSGDTFEIKGPLAEVISLSRLGLGWSREKLADEAGVCTNTIVRAETDTNIGGSWGWLRTRTQILRALGMTLQAQK